MEKTIPDRFINMGYPRHQSIDFDQEASLFLETVNKAKSESDVQKYIKDNQKWFIPGSLFRNYDFGHHEAYISPEQSLGGNYRVDYMLLGRNSVGYHIVFVEFESVNVEYRNTSDNSETQYVRKGLTQINDWKRWIDNNRSFFLENTGLRDIAGNIPSWGIKYCLVVSRRSKMDSLANEMRGQREWEAKDLKIVSYDRLVDNTRALVNGF